MKVKVIHIGKLHNCVMSIVMPTLREISLLMSKCKSTNIKLKVVLVVVAVVFYRVVLLLFI